MMHRRRIPIGIVLAVGLALAVIIFLRPWKLRSDETRNLESVLVFADPSQCRTAEPLTRIAQALRDFEYRAGGERTGPSISLPGFPEPLRPHRIRSFGIGRDAMGFGTMAELEIRGRWHGLNVVALRSTSGDNPEILFSDRPEHVRQTLSRAGFPLPAVDQWQQPDYSSTSPAPMTSVQSRRDGASFYCEPVVIP